MKNEKRCYVIMPFSDTKSCTEKEWTEIFEHVIKPAVEESGLGYKCERSRAKRENIIKGIINDLNTAQVVISDLTDYNPNVFYELGVRHTLQNRTILIAQDEKFIPSDLMNYPTVFYECSPKGVDKFKKEIKEQLKEIETNPERADNPVADFLSNRNITLISSDKKANLAKLAALISELSYNIEAVDSIREIIKESEKAREKGEGFFATTQRFDNACLELFLSTLYIMPPQQLLGHMKGINDDVIKSNSKLGAWQEEAFAIGVEETLQEELPKFKKALTSLLKEIIKVMADYASDNYIAPEAPVILLSSAKHKKYLEMVR